MTPTRILIVEDDRTLCETLQFNLELEKFQVTVAYSAEEALSLPLESYSLILLDVMMGELSGFKFAQMLKAEPMTANIPIIFCTAKDTEDDMIAGLTIGADDYIMKPYTIRNVVARIKAVLRRSAPTAIDSPDIIRYDMLELDLLFKRCMIYGKDARLARKEFEILAFLLKSQGKIFSRQEILEAIWGSGVEVLKRTIDVNINRLRHKIAPYDKHIITRPGYGYGFR